MYPYPRKYENMAYMKLHKIFGHSSVISLGYEHCKQLEIFVLNNKSAMTAITMPFVCIVFIAVIPYIFFLDKVHLICLFIIGNVVLNVFRQDL